MDTNIAVEHCLPCAPVEGKRLPGKRLTLRHPGWPGRSWASARALQTIAKTVPAGHPHVDRRVQLVAAAVEIVCNGEIVLAADGECLPAGRPAGRYPLERNAAARAAAEAGGG